MDDVVLGNVYDKYSTRNPLARMLQERFLKSAYTLISRVPAARILEVGCGETHLASLVREWKPNPQICGIDVSAEIFDRKLASRARVQLAVQSAEALGFPDETFDIVIAAEVLEHLENPEAALREIQRVTCRHVLLSVPREPLWRALNIARFSYVKDFGNTPGHLQHWSKNSFVKMVSKYFEVLEVASPTPWTMLLAAKA